MNEKSLSKAIDRLANKKADDLLNNIRKAVNEALKPYWRHNDASEEFHADDIKNVLTEYVALIGSSEKHYKVKPTAELVDNCRAKIIDDLLKGLPKLNELAAMADQFENTMPIGAEHFDHDQD